MPMNQARALAPHAVILPPPHEKYRAVSLRVLKILRDVPPIVEQLSKDKAFLDVSGARRRLGPPAVIAASIRTQIAAERGAVASVGAAATKFVAKLASGEATHDGMLLIPEPATIEFLPSLPVGAIWGVGERTEARLANAGITSVKELAHTPVRALRSLLGTAAAARLHDLSWGRDPRPVEVQREDKSIGHEQTFPTNLTEREDMHAVLLDQAHRCAARLRSQKLLGAVIAIKVRYSDFTTMSRSITLTNPTDVAYEIYQAGTRLFDQLAIPRNGVRLLGIRCEGLTDSATTAIQPLLGEDGPEREP